MNCANHPERTANAFCQQCGKPLCPECVRSSDGLILCEPDLAARQAAGSQAATQAGPAAGSGWTTVPGGSAPVSGFTAAPPNSGAHASPGLAALLGFIPGVGAMYNGQFVKALIHVVIFMVLVGASEHIGVLGILVAAWVFYQVFDAAQTAGARRDGRPLPDPFGILDMSQRLGPQGNSQGGVPSGGYVPSAYPPPPVPSGMGASAGPGPGPGPGAVPGAVPGAAGFHPSSRAASPGFAPGAVPAPQGQPGADARWRGQAQANPAQFARQPDSRWTAMPPSAPPNPQAYAPVPAAPRRGEPVGAIVLIVVGLLFLLSTLGVLDVDWISRGWPLLVLLLGIWLLIRRATAPPAQFPGAPMPPPVHPVYPGETAAGTPLAHSPLNVDPYPGPQSGERSSSRPAETSPDASADTSAERAGEHETQHGTTHERGEENR